MGKLEPLINGRVVTFDTVPLIYYIEENPNYLPFVEEFFELIDSGSILCVASVLTLLEMLVKPQRECQKEIANRYREILIGSRNIELCPIEANICETAADLRSRYRWLRTPDAIHIATAISNKASAIVTNDKGWKNVVEINVICLDEL